MDFGILRAMKDMKDQEVSRSIVALEECGLA